MIGYGDFKRTFLILADHYGFDLKPYPGLVHAHNVPLQIFMETGLIGIVLLVLPWWVVFSILVRTWTAGPDEAASTAGCLITIIMTILVSSQMDLTLAHHSGILIYYLLGTGFALRWADVGRMDVSPSDETGNRVSR